MSIAGHARVGLLVRDRERDRARAGADVEHAGLLDAVEEREAALDDDLGLGPRDQRPAVDVQRQPPEAPLAEHVGERLARAAPLDELAGTRPARLVERPSRSCRARRAETPEHVREQLLGVDLRRGATPAALQGRGRLAEAPRASSHGGGFERAAPVLGLERLGELVELALEDPVERCTVSLIRWSVTRFSGKL